MEDIPIAYPVLDNTNDYLITNIKYDDDYDFVIKYQIDNFIEITLKKSYVVYQQLITKSNMQLSRLYKLIINSLNKESNYLIDINVDVDIQLDIAFNSDIIDINEQIILIKQSDQKSIELLLVEKIKELENKLSICNMYIHKKICIDDNYYDINTEDLDLSTSGTYFKSKYEFDNALNRFTNIKTITIDGGLFNYLLTPIKDIYDYRNNIDTIIIDSILISIGYLDISLLLNYCCSLQSTKKQTILIKNTTIRLGTNMGNFLFSYNIQNEIIYNMLSNSKINFKIILEKVSYEKQDYGGFTGKSRMLITNGVCNLSNFQEFITISKLDKYNIFQNI